MLFLPGNPTWFPQMEVCPPPQKPLSTALVQKSLAQEPANLLGNSGLSLCLAIWCWQVFTSVSLNNKIQLSIFEDQIGSIK